MRHCGSEEVQVRDGEEQIWADGINAQAGQLLEAKFVENPKNSPYVSDSNVPAFIRTKAVNDVENEFRRYAAVINDVNTPVVELQVIVNIEEAVSFFESLLSKYNIPGFVVVRF
ncbi:restriction endonuclease fold toxin-2 domain-containing protein [Aerosakkonemataceae cyanobacterium BLCC-F154]|uniref:Restriction endonuclease fold toxin-2 domain-containing protein n=1 Tax=Floridaenema fluviatile BLCC-F154 TaxID=3153640 RepID=A0ABV4YF51_9CYAN